MWQKGVQIVQKLFGSAAPKTRQLDEWVMGRIEEARRRGGEDLNLWNSELEELPNEIWSLPALESIDLRDNELRTIPARLRNLRHLKRIDLRANPLEKLPDVPGLVIDEDTYQRCRGEFDPSNITGIAIDGHTAQDDETYWLRELR